MDLIPHMQVSVGDVPPGPSDLIAKKFQYRQKCKNVAQFLSRGNLSMCTMRTNELREAESIKPVCTSLILPRLPSYWSVLTCTKPSIQHVFY